MLIVNSRTEETPAEFYEEEAGFGDERGGAEQADDVGPEGVCSAGPELDVSRWVYRFTSLFSVHTHTHTPTFEKTADPHHVAENSGEWRRSGDVAILSCAINISISKV